MKFSPEGKLVYSTYLGGDGIDKGFSITADVLGNAYVMGGTSSDNFPTTAAVLQTSRRGPWDAFVTKLNPSGNSLIYSTYLGGSGGGETEGDGGGITIDASGNAYVTGSTDSSDFPVTADVFQFLASGAPDAFVTKINSSGTALVYSAYLGGSDSDRGASIAVDSLGNAYVAGTTRSKDFPTTVSALQPARSGASEDAFMAKINPSGTFLTYSTYLGGELDDEGNAVLVTDPEDVYVVGTTQSRSFPATPNTIKDQDTRNLDPEDNADAFVAKFDTTLVGNASLIFATFLGGTGDDFGLGATLNEAGNVYVTGFTRSADFPTSSPIQSTLATGSTQDAFMSKMNLDGTQLVYSTYLGGSNDDSGQAMAVDTEGNAWVTGVTDSTDFPTAVPLQKNAGGMQDAFVLRISDGDGSPPLPTVSTGITITPPTSSYQLAQTLTADFTVTNQGGRPIHFQQLVLASSNTSIGVPNFSYVSDIVLDSGASYDYEGTLTLTQLGTFHFMVAYQTPDNQWHTNLPADQGATSALDLTVVNTTNAQMPQNIITSSSDNDQCTIPFGTNTCTSTIKWSTINVNPDDAQVFVQDIGIGGNPSLFATAQSGSIDAPWIQRAPHLYKFSVNQVKGNVRTELASVEVTGLEGDPPGETGSILASPRACTIPEGSVLCTATINWSSIDSVTDGIVYVQDVGMGAAPTPFAAGPSGSVDAPWIQGPPHRYVFILYQGSADSLKPAAAVEVTGNNGKTPSNASGTLSASPNPCVVSSGNTCAAIIQWNTTTNVIDARVVVRDIHKGATMYFASGKSGPAIADFIEAAPHRYLFTLYQLGSGTLITLDTIEVDGVQAPADSP